jgi:undecaprenyl-diphosphatase
VLVLYGRALLVSWQVLARVAVAFVPTRLRGLAGYRLVKQHLLENHPLTLSMLAGGGVILIAFECWHREDAGAADDLARLSWRDCALVGCFQALAFVPGVSRAAATILGGLLLGWKRKTAVEFSFLLAVPTMAASTALDLWKSSSDFSPEQVQLLLVGFLTSFVVALLAIQFLLRYIRTHTFIPFGIYRLIFAIVLGIWLYAL